MQAELTLLGGAAQAGYLSWVPIQGEIRLTDRGTATAPVNVRLRGRRVGTNGGGLRFFATLTGPEQNELPLTLPLDGTSVPFFVGGRFNQPSRNDRDVILEAVVNPGTTVIAAQPLMVRVRKNANTLTLGERNRLLRAFATLNNRGMGTFSDFRNMHVQNATREAHGAAGFLPWHRAYLLDLERELQRIDPSVALPYWRFDQPAPRLFTQSFIGVTSASGQVRFSATNPLQFWTTDQQPGIVRQPFFNVATEAPDVADELATINMGGLANRFAQFMQMEGDPHGSAHVSFGGYISAIGTAARDPLFFLLHANVDRLWAKWQWIHRRFNAITVDAYPFLTSAGAAGAIRVGHNLNDTMWPWNQITTQPRPSTAPGGAFPPSPRVAAPGPTPTIGAMIDYQGRHNRNNYLGFDYDDVPFGV